MDYLSLNERTFSPPHTHRREFKQSKKCKRKPSIIAPNPRFENDTNLIITRTEQKRHKRVAMPPKVLIVTGASRGIGLAVAKYLLNASHKVVLVSRSQKQLQTIKDQFPSQVQFLAADLTDMAVSSHQIHALGLIATNRGVSLADRQTET